MIECLTNWISIKGNPMTTNIIPIEQYYKEKQVTIEELLVPSLPVVRNKHPHFLVNVSKYCYVYGDTDSPSRFTLPFDSTHITSNPLTTPVPIVWKLDPNNLPNVWTEQGTWKLVDKDIYVAYTNKTFIHSTNKV